jgi:hypothetical protein
MAAKKKQTRKPSRSSGKTVSKKPQGKKGTLKKSVPRRKTVPKKPATTRKKRVVKKPVPSARRSSWLDEQAQTPVIDRYARQLGSFLDAIADGKIDEGEIKGQEARLVKLMRKIEPQLDTTLHAEVTQLLCELTAYDIMQLMYAMQHARPQTVFHG